MKNIIVTLKYGIDLAYLHAAVYLHLEGSIHDLVSNRLASKNYIIVVHLLIIRTVIWSNFPDKSQN